MMRGLRKTFSERPDGLPQQVAELFPQQKQRWDELRETILEEIKAFGAESNGYGEILHNHLTRTADDAAGFLAYLGYDQLTRQRIYEAMLIHDWGKIDSQIFSPEDWITPQRPGNTLREKRRRHPDIGRRNFEQLLNRQDSDLLNHAYFRDIVPMILSDHEKLRHDNHMMCTLAIVDAYDGDINHIWPHQDGQRDITEEFRRLLGISADQKYTGQTDTDLVLKYADHKGGKAMHDQLVKELDQAAQNKTRPESSKAATASMGG